MCNGAKERRRKEEKEREREREKGRILNLSVNKGREEGRRRDRKPGMVENRMEGGKKYGD